MANDHKVPQFYLRSFHTCNSPGLIYSYKSGFRPKEVSIAQKAACEEGYYDLEDELLKTYSKYSNFILGTIEHHSAKILGQIIQKNELPLSIQDKWAFALFISTLCVRNPRVHTFLKEQILAEQKSVLSSFASNKAAFRDVMDQLEPGLSVAEIEETRQAIFEPDSPLNFGIPDSEHNKSYIRSLLPSAHYVILARRLSYYNWYLLSANADEYFITSDNPVVFLEPIAKDELGLMKCPLFLPLSPKLAFFAHPLSLSKQIINILNTRTEEFNDHILGFANEFAYSDVKDDRIASRLNGTFRPLSQLNYQYNFLGEKQLKFAIKNEIIKI